MTTNRVLAHKTLELVTKAGKRLVIGAATKTELWERPEAGITAATTEAFKKAVVEYTLELPEGTEKVIWRYIFPSLSCSDAANFNKQ